MGYHFEETVKRPRKYIIALAPHTSNWDFIMALLFMGAEQFQCGFMMKKEWFFWPLGPIFKRMGGIPVYREKNRNVTYGHSRLARPMNSVCALRLKAREDANPSGKKGSTTSP